MKALAVVLVTAAFALVLFNEAWHQKREAVGTKSFKTTSYRMTNGVLYCEKSPGHWHRAF